MTTRTKPASAGHVTPIAPTKAQKDHASATTRAAVELFDGMIAAGLAPLFPADLPPSAVRAILVNELGFSVKYAKAGAAQKNAVAHKDIAEKAAEKLRRRATQLVDSAHPSGSEK